MRLTDHLTAERVVTLTGATKEEVLRELVAVTGSAAAVADPEALLQAIFDREAILSTGIGLGIAVPHAKIESVEDFTVAVGVSRDGVDFQALDDQPAHIIVLIAAPIGRQRDYLGLLAQVTVLLKEEETRSRVIEAAEDPSRVHRILSPRR